MKEKLIYKWKEIKKKLFSEVKMDPKDKNVYKNELRGIIYVLSILFIWGMGKRLIAFPIEFAQSNNLDVNAVAKLVLEDYNITITVIMLTALLTIPIYDILLRLKKLGKENLEFYKDTELIDERIFESNSQQINNDIRKIIESDDKILDDESCEKEIIERNSEENKKNIIDMKASNIIEYINPIVQQVLTILYYNKINISISNIIGILDSKRVYRKISNEMKKNIAKAIITFLVNNDIIESDEMEDSYYFTNFADVVMKEIGKIK